MSTIYEIAEKVGVSPKTAARILAGQSQRSKHREAVLGAARELGYVRNLHAANLRTGRSGLVGTLVPDIKNPFYTKFLQEAHDLLKAKSYHSLIGCSFGDPEQIGGVLNQFRAYNVDGIIFNGSEGDLGDDILEIFRSYHQSSHPIVLIGRDPKDLPVDVINIRNVDAVKKVISYLAGKGHKRIAFVGGPGDNQTIQHRHQGFLEGVQAHGLKTRDEWICFGEATASDGGFRALQIWNESKTSGEQPTAYVCANDQMAMGTIRNFALEGIRVPEDVAVTGYDDIEQAGLYQPAITTVRQPLREMAQAAVDLLDSRLKTKDFSNPRTLTFDTELVVRESA